MVKLQNVCMYSYLTKIMTRGLFVSYSMEKSTLPDLRATGLRARVCIRQTVCTHVTTNICHLVSGLSGHIDHEPHVHKKLSKRCETHNCNWTIFITNLKWYYIRVELPNQKIKVVCTNYEHTWYENIL